MELVKNMLSGQELTEDQLASLFAAIVDGEVDNMQLAAMLAAMHTRGERPEEIRAAATALLDAAIAFELPEFPVVDAAGTGGDGHGTINISTAASLAVAALGGGVIKHGNKAISSLSGSADVIAALNIPIPQSVDQAQSLLHASGFVFLHAALFHPAMGRFMPVRQALGIPTMFNIIGPLLNPARPRLQMMGVGNAAQLDLVAATMAMLGREHAIVMHGSGLDEIAVHGPTQIREIRGEDVRSYTVTPDELGLGTYPLEALRGGNPTENAAIVMDILAGAGTPAQTASVAANAGALAYLLGMAPSLVEGVQMMLHALREGQCASYLETLRTQPQAA